ncbi:hypothetical protein VRU48_10605 [Pedobacter sp. KR3-3]|uniref:Uncharacterized protein n=1 Tax=Pedobacter albus TaxID=3113905 RepID=A0ABU7I7V5_9SPHI|nr:hypothetical protein [Pedobacter sp. KR3-3]MEE1945557.1 hypothetical protein [Pedobacter sp. KR3-3]
MLKTIRSLYTFYLSHFFAGLFISLSCMYLYHLFGNLAIPAICWYKAFTVGIFFYAVNTRKRREFVYYQNLGISKKLLWGVTLGIDFLLFVVLMALTK